MVRTGSVYRDASDDVEWHCVHCVKSACVARAYMLSSRDAGNFDGEAIDKSSVERVNTSSFGSRDKLSEMH